MAIHALTYTAMLLLALAHLPLSSSSSPAIFGGRRASEMFVIDGESSAPWEGLLKFEPGPDAFAPDTKFPLVLAAKRTRRSDMLNKFRLYRGGWDITNKHYWASVGFTRAVGFILAFLWFVSLGLALLAYHCCKWGIGMKDKISRRMQRIGLMFLLVFMCAAA